jgi:molybdate transport system substrate-binding protein
MARHAVRSCTLARWLSLLVTGAILALVAFGDACSKGRQGVNAPLVVSAAASLKESLEEIQPLFERQHGVAIRYNFGGSGALEQQVEHGAPVDVFISAAPREMDALERRGLLENGTRRNLVTNELVVVTGARSPPIAGFDDLVEAGVRRIAMAEPESVPAGHYARETLQHLGLWERLQTKLVFTGDVRQALIDVETSNADAALVYDTEAKLDPQLKVVASAPAGSHSPIVYPVAVITGQHRDRARAFVSFLFSPEAQAVFARHGFRKAEGSPQ